MSLFDLLDSEQPASEPEALDIALWMAGRKAITNNGKVATFRGIHTHEQTGCTYLKAEMPVDPLKQGAGKPTAIFWLDLYGRWEGSLTAAPTLKALI